ncbi:MAG: phosphate ABC transporter permease subunit PstC [Desulfobulbaceae bacterium A2]|nr:MAG: phosphate ABC transporter permease subunit PstC [Desulfobulbaceae bacterium A2]
MPELLVAHESGPGGLSPRDRLVRSLCTLFLLVGTGVLALTIAYLCREAGLGSDFFRRSLDCFTAEWKPLATPPQLGLAHAWASTFLVTGIAMALSLPFGFGIGLFVAELAPPALRRLLSPALELLAGIPAVVYGFFGAVTLVRWFEHLFQLPSGETLLGAGIVLAVMMLPFIASTSGEAFRAVYAEYREGVLALGVDQFTMFRRVILIRALPGLIAAAALGLARGVGETLAVLMLSGNTTAFPGSVLSRGQPLTALLATEIGETAVHSDKYRMLFTGALFLMLMVLALNFAVSLMKRSTQRLYV